MKEDPRIWHWPVQQTHALDIQTTKDWKHTSDMLWFDYATRGNDISFLYGLNAIQVFLEHQRNSVVITSHEDALDYCTKHAVYQSALKLGPSEFASHSWRHENAHKSAALGNGIQGAIRACELRLADRTIHQFYFQYRINDLYRASREGTLLAAIVATSEAPESIELGYRREMRKTHWLKCRLKGLPITDLPEEH